MAKKASKKAARARKPWPLIKRITYRNGTEAWLVDTRMKGQGSRVFKATEEQANEVARQARIRRQNEGTGYFSLEGPQRLDAEQALAMLAPYNKTLVQAVEFFIPHLRALQTSKTVREAADAYEASAVSRGLSKAHLKDIRIRLGNLCQTFGERSIAMVTAEELDSWLDRLGVSTATKNGYRRYAVALWSFAQNRKWCSENEAGKTSLAKVVSGEVGILTPDEAQALLTAAHPEILPALAIGAFAGLRRAELERLEWRSVNIAERFVEVLASNAKSARRRTIHMSDNLAAWLAPYTEARGAVWPSKEKRGRRLFEDAARAAGFGTPGSETPEERKEGVKLKPWPSNALRHSFASYYLAHHNDASKLALEMGHTTNALIFAHYRQVVRASEAARYWEVRPAITVTQA